MIAGRLSPKDEQAVSRGLDLNAAGVIADRDGGIDTARLPQMPKPLPAGS